MLEAMRGSGRVAIARVVLRQKEHLVALRATDEVLVMETLVFADEVVAPSTLDEVRDARGRGLRARARGRAPADRDAVRTVRRHPVPRRLPRGVLALIERKVAGEQIAIAPAAPAPRPPPT
jgi:DNA end-binding protein Ku